mmetsp:Transcript_4676/g.6643  ORF Transcript_4676/g.6643 Transcript_4676/m.6643 type:complete len:226 (+) Transcript_4676:93-770(+)
MRDTRKFTISLLLLILPLVVKSFAPSIIYWSRGVNHNSIEQVGALKQRIIFPSNHEFQMSNGNDNSSVDITGQNSDSFWEMQKELAVSMSESTEASRRREENAKYDKKVVALVTETFYFSVIISSVLWLIASNPFTPISYLLGGVLGTAYSYGLGKYVQTFGGSVMEPEDIKGAGVGSARFAFLILLFIFVGKFRSQGLQEIPAVFGFFTYQIASLSQGLKKVDL